MSVRHTEAIIPGTPTSSGQPAQDIHHCAHANEGCRADVQSLKDALLKTWKTEGLSGLYSGLGSSLFGIIVTNGVYYGFCALATNFFQKCLTTRRRDPFGFAATTITELDCVPRSDHRRGNHCWSYRG